VKLAILFPRTKEGNSSMGMKNFLLAPVLLSVAFAFTTFIGCNEAGTNVNGNANANANANSSIRAESTPSATATPTPKYSEEQAAGRARESQGEQRDNRPVSGRCLDSHQDCRQVDRRR
jgi:hypothetical protein